MERNVTSSMDYAENRTTWAPFYTWVVTEETYGENSSAAANNDTSLLGCEIFELQYRIIPSVICVVLFLFGVLYCFLGELNLFILFSLIHCRM